MAAPASRHQRNILVVDDEERLAQSLASLLRGAGYTVDASTSGSDGIAAMQRTEYDLIITDLRMEGVDGFDIMHYIAANCPRSALIVITGHATTQSAIEALHRRAADYITKPFDFDVLRASIERVFAQQEAQRLREDMVNMLTHDIKVPLTSIRGFAQMLLKEDGSLHDDAARFSRLIMLNAQKTLIMLDNYLTNARLEAGRLHVDKAPVDPEETLLENLILLEFEFQKRNIQLDVSIAGDLPRSAQLDETLFARCIGNLLSNASKYTPPGGRVRVELTAESNMLRLCVANDGVELTEKEVAGLFNRYQRASSSRGEEGTGLGLHIVKSIAERHGGSVRCDLKDDEIEFWVELPV